MKLQESDEQKDENEKLEVEVKNLKKIAILNVKEITSWKKKCEEKEKEKKELETENTILRERLVMAPLGEKGEDNKEMEKNKEKGNKDEKVEIENEEEKKEESEGK